MLIGLEIKGQKRIFAFKLINALFYPQSGAAGAAAMALPAGIFQQQLAALTAGGITLQHTGKLLLFFRHKGHFSPLICNCDVAVRGEIWQNPT